MWQFYNAATSLGLLELQWPHIFWAIFCHVILLKGPTNFGYPILILKPPWNSILLITVVPILTFCTCRIGNVGKWFRYFRVLWSWNKDGYAVIYTNKRYAVKSEIVDLLDKLSFTSYSPLLLTSKNEMLRITNVQLSEDQTALLTLCSVKWPFSNGRGP